METAPGSLEPTRCTYNTILIIFYNVTRILLQLKTFCKYNKYGFLKTLLSSAGASYKKTQ